MENKRRPTTYKVILGSSSPFFENLLRRNKHAHPLIYMRGVKSEDLLAIIDFLYCGETNVYQENLDSFLAIAEELKLKGLTGKSGVDEEVTEKYLFKAPSQEELLPIFKNETKKAPGLSQSKLYNQAGKTVALTNNFSEDLKELLERSNSMMEKTSRKTSSGMPVYCCKVCGKEGKSDNIKNHIEANHLEGVTLPCTNCEKTFRSRKSLDQHTHRIHKNNI